jgi:cytochrome oxidase Cu insertion factor (SCO1/SenC/PrrC family)
VGGLAALVLVLSFVARLFGPPPGTLVVLLSSRSATTLKGQPLSIHSSGGWTSLPPVSARVPAAPAHAQVAEVEVPAGHYDSVRLGSNETAASFDVVSGKVQPVLLAVSRHSVSAGGVYAGNEAVNLGLGEIAGKYTALPSFALVDQAGRQVTDADLRGAPLVLAAFHTTCRATCPLYTGLLLQLQRKLGSSIHLVEVTTDPADTPAVLRAYAKRVGARWEFLTGSAGALQAFWAPLQVGIASGDSHVSTLAIADSHGYLRLVYRGVPDTGILPPPLTAQLDTTGLAELGHGDGWGAPDVLASLRTVETLFQPEQPGGGRAPGFTLDALDGSRVSLAGLSGQPVVVSFWATYCPVCTSELPQLVDIAGRHPGVALLLIDERDDAAAARGFLAGLKLHPRVLEDADGAVGRRYGVQGLPVTFFVRPDGLLAGSFLGAIDAASLDARMAELSGQ